MARDFKTSVIFPVQAGAAATLGVANTNPTGVFRTGLNTLSITSAGAASTADMTAKSSDFFFVDEQLADQLQFGTVNDGTKGDGLSTAAAPLGIRNATAPSSVNTTSGLWTYAAAHGLVNGQTIVFTAITGGSGAFALNKPYNVIVLSPLTFYVAERWSTIPIVPATNVTASTYYATNAVYGLGPTAAVVASGALPEPLPSQYVRPLYLRVNLVPTNVTYASIATAVSLQNLTIQVLGSHVRGFSGNTGAIADLDNTPYQVVTTKTWNQVFADGVTPINGRGLLSSMPIQTDFPFLRFNITVGRVETATGQFAASSAANFGLGLSLVTGRENAQP